MPRLTTSGNFACPRSSSDGATLARLFCPFCTSGSGTFIQIPFSECIRRTPKSNSPWITLPQTKSTKVTLISPNARFAKLSQRCPHPQDYLPMEKTLEKENSHEMEMKSKTRGLTSPWLNCFTQIRSRKDIMPLPYLQ